MYDIANRSSNANDTHSPSEEVAINEEELGGSGSAFKRSRIMCIMDAEVTDPPQTDWCDMIRKMEELGS